MFIGWSAADSSAVALRGANGRLSMIKSGNDVFAFREWLASDADSRTPKDDTLGEGIRCDAAGCVGRLRDGSLVAIAKTRWVAVIRGVAQKMHSQLR